MKLIGMAGRGRDVSDLLHDFQGGLALRQVVLALVPGAGDPPIQGGLGSHDLLGLDRQG